MTDPAARLEEFEPIEVDADVDLPSVVEIVHPHPGSERKRSMRGGELLHIVDFSRRGAPSVVRIAVPARDSGFSRTYFRGRGNSRGSSPRAR